MIQVVCRQDGSLTCRIAIRTVSVFAILMETYWIGTKVVLACLAGEEEITGITTVATNTFRLAARFPIAARLSRLSGH